MSLALSILALLYGGYKFVGIEYVVTGKIKQQEKSRTDFIAAALAMLAGVTLSAGHFFGYSNEFTWFFVTISTPTTVGFLARKLFLKS